MKYILIKINPSASADIDYSHETVRKDMRSCWQVSGELPEEWESPGEPSGTRSKHSKAGPILIAEVELRKTGRKETSVGYTGTLQVNKAHPGDSQFFSWTCRKVTSSCCQDAAWAVLVLEPYGTMNMLLGKVVQLTLSTISIRMWKIKSRGLRRFSTPADRLCPWKGCPLSVRKANTPELWITQP